MALDGVTKELAGAGRNKMLKGQDSVKIQTKIEQGAELIIPKKKTTLTEDGVL